MVSTVTQLAAEDILTFHCYAKTLAGELEANSKSEWTSNHMSFNPDLN